MMKSIFLFLLLVLGSMMAYSQAAVVGDSCGHMRKYRVLISQFTGSANDSAWALVYYPDEYFDSTSKKYPVIYSQHGSGEGADSFPNKGSQLCRLEASGLPQMIANGIKPMGVHSGVTFKFIVISIQYVAGFSPPWYFSMYSFPFFNSLLRIDTNRMYMTGYSYGGYSTYDMWTNGSDSSWCKKFAAYMPQSVATLEGFRIPFLRIAARDTFPVLTACGTADGFFPTSQAYIDTINTASPSPDVPGIFISRPGLAHQAAVWDSLYSPTYRPSEIAGMSGYEWFLQYVKSPRGPTTGNQPPIANSGGNKTITLPTSSVTLIGSATPLNGATIVSFSWVQTSGPTTATLSGVSTSTLTASGLTQGTYVFTLIVTDNHGLSDNNLSTVTVNAAPVNTKPNVNAGADQSITLPSNSVVLTGIATGTNGATIVSTIWTQTAGPNAASISTASSLTSTMSGLIQGTYIFSLKAIDNNSLDSTDLITVVVNPISGTFIQRYQFGTGEYNNYGLDRVTHHAYNIAGDTLSVPGMPNNVSFVASGAHHGCVLDSVGNAYCSGDNSVGQLGLGFTGALLPGMNKILVDTFGNPFTNIIQIVPTGSVIGYYTLALKADGTVWGWGDLRQDIRGNGTSGGITIRPVPILFPAGIFIKKLVASIAVFALDANGHLWDWGANANFFAPYVLAQGTFTPVTNLPTQLSFPSTVVDMAGSSDWNYALLSNHSLYGWAFHSGYIVIGSPTDSGASNPGATPFPKLMDSALFPYFGTRYPTKISTNSNGTYAILNDSTAWFWGDNVEGGAGDGNGINWATYITPYAWNFQAGTKLYRKPVQVGKGINNFTSIFCNPALNYYVMLGNVHDSIFVAGKDKGGPLGTGVVNCDTALGTIAAFYPDSWERDYLTVVDPLHQSFRILTSSPLCVTTPSSTGCSNCTIPTVTSPVASAGSNQTISISTATITGTATPNGIAKIIKQIWTCTSKPSGAADPLIVLPSGISARVSGLVTGTYTFSLTVTDNTWRTGTSTITITVGAPPAPPCGCINFNLPTQAQKLP